MGKVNRKIYVRDIFNWLFDFKQKRVTMNFLVLDRQLFSTFCGCGARYVISKFPKFTNDN